MSAVSRDAASGACSILPAAGAGTVEVAGCGVDGPLVCRDAAEGGGAEVRSRVGVQQDWPGADTGGSLAAKGAGAATASHRSSSLGGSGSNSTPSYTSASVSSKPTSGSGITASSP